MPKNQNKMESDIRNKPLVEPLKSPSPDFHNSHAMSPTFSPSRQQLKRNSQLTTKAKESTIKMDISWEPSLKQNRTPSTIHANKKRIVSRQRYQQLNYLTKSHQRIVKEVDTHHHHHHYSDYQSAPAIHVESSCSRENRRDNNELVGELRKILAMISDSEFVSEFSADEYVPQQHLRKQNEKLKLKLEALQRIMTEQSKKGKIQPNYDVLRRINLLETQNHDLKNHIYHMKQDFEQEKIGLIQSNKSLAAKLRLFDESNNKLSFQNERLLKLLKEKDQSQRKLFQEHQDLKDSLLLRGNQESMVNANNFSITSENQRDKRLAIIKERYNNSLEQIKGQLQQGVKNSIKNGVKQFNQIQRKVKETEHRLETLNRFIIASLRLKGKTEYLKRSKVIKQTYEMNHQSELKKMNEWVDSIRIQKQNVVKEARLRQQSLIDKVRQQEKSNENLRRQNNKHQSKIEQLSLEMLRLTDQIKEIEHFKNEQIQQLNRIIILKNRQIQQINRGIQRRISQSQKTNSAKQEWLKQLLQKKQKQVDELKQTTEAKVKQLVSSYQKQLQLNKKELIAKSSQLKDVTTSRTEQQNDLLSRLKLSQFEKNDILEKMDRNVKKYQYELQDHLSKIQQLGKQNREKETNIRQANNQIQRLVGILREKDKLIAEIESQNRNLWNSSQNQKVLKESLQRTQLQYNYKEQRIIGQFTTEINSVKLKISQKDQQIANLQQTISKLKSRSIVKELMQIKELVNNSDSQKIQSQLNEVTASYGRLNLQLQSKVSQNQLLSKEKLELKERAFQLQQKICTLNQKINYLEKHIDIYAGQLKQRKQLCQGLIQQKSMLEKQMMLFKKSNFDQKRISSSIQKIILVSKKIDELIVIENERQYSRVN